VARCARGKGQPRVLFWKVYEARPAKGRRRWRPRHQEGNKRFVARYYTVFNIEQCEGLEYPKPVLPDPEKSGATPIERAEKIVSGYKGPTLETKGSLPCYSPTRDVVEMPARELFFSPEVYTRRCFTKILHVDWPQEAGMLIAQARKPLPRLRSTRLSREE